MQPDQLFAEKMSALKQRSTSLEQRIKDDMKSLSDMTDANTLWQKAKDGALRVFSDRRTYYIAGGVVVSYFVLRALLSRGRHAAHDGDNPNMPVVVRPEPSLLHRVLMTAIQTFVLHYTRKLLVDFLERNERKPDTLTPPAKS